MKTNRIALLLLSVVALVAVAAVTEPTGRSYVLRKLQIYPEMRATNDVVSSTNLVEVSDFSRTNRWGIGTNRANAGASVMGPRLYTTLGGTQYNAVTNKTFTITNAGTVQTFIVINGLIVEYP